MSSHLCLQRGLAAFAIAIVALAEPVLAVERPDLSAAERQRVHRITSPTSSFLQAEKYEAMQAGAGTSKHPMDRHAFSQPLTNLSFSDRERFTLGDGLFRKSWVSSPASTQASDGLGPLFNARSCQFCHVKDGRGHLPVDGEVASPFFLQLGWYDKLANYWRADEVYGRQLQTVAVAGHRAEARVQIDYSDQPVVFVDGARLNLRKPSYSLRDLAYGPLDKRTQLSPKIAPQMIGMGLLAAISEVDILAKEDVDDKNADGISGRASRVVSNGKVMLGRFGLKAAQASVKEQSAGAFAGDMGLSNSLHPSKSGDCSEAQERCQQAPHGEQLRLGRYEVPEPLLDLVSFYSSNLAVPARRDVDDAEVLRGKSLFYKSACTSCHTPKYVTSSQAIDKQHRFQLIWPYTDLLLHDMGVALADGVGHNAGATGSEWRTPPLWGIGLTNTVNARASYLHDGRARTLLEAVMWHGGEASSARELVRQMTAADRAALVRFLASL